MTKEITFEAAPLPPGLIDIYWEKAGSYCVHGKCSPHFVGGNNTKCIGPFTRSAYDSAIIESERPKGAR